jgi:hypothetical protein
LRSEADATLWPALNAAAATLIRHYELDELLEVIMDIVARAVPAQRGALLLRRADRRGLEPEDPPAELDQRRGVSGHAAPAP